MHTEVNVHAKTEASAEEIAHHAKGAVNEALGEHAKRIRHAIGKRAPAPGADDGSE
jgi:hypothetical protein